MKTLAVLLALGIAMAAASGWTRPVVSFLFLALSIGYALWLRRCVQRLKGGAPSDIPPG